MSDTGAVHTEIRMFVPLHGKHEVWRVKLKNTSDVGIKADFYPVFSLNTAGMGSRCIFDREHKLFYSYAFPYHVKYGEYEDKNTEDNYTYVYCGTMPDSYECGELRFFGSDNHAELPFAVGNGICSCCISENDKPLAAAHSSVELLPGQEKCFYYVLGCCRDIETVKNGICTEKPDKWAEEQFSQCVDFWDNAGAALSVDTQDAELNRLINHWLPKQIVSMNLTHRFEELSCVRNELQDALGYSLLNPKQGFMYLKKVFLLQEKSGELKQWHIVNNTSPIRRLGLLTYYDGPIWLILCACIILKQTGDLSHIYEVLPYADSNRAESIYEHIMSAVKFMKTKRGAHGLVLFADGDWTDPLNGMGGDGRGETVWGSEALLYAVRLFADIARRAGDDEAVDYLTEYAEDLERAINDCCWDGEWYILGYNDAGERVGTSTDTEGKIFLNAQTWAIISGAAKGERLLKTLDTINSIETPCGPMVNYPAFSKWNKNIGRASLKLSGTTENGAVYCHASMFKAYAECVAERYDDAYDTIKRTMPENEKNPSERNLQAPIFVPNYYYGLPESPNFGISSNVYSTGTADWMLWIITEELLGIRTDFDGISVKPHIPSCWNGAYAVKCYKDAVYRITIRRGTKKCIIVNSQMIDGVILPYKAGGEYEVIVIV